MAVTENTNRGLFTLSGITGMAIAVVLLLVIAFGLTAWAINVQQGSSSNFYDPTPITSNLDNVKANSKENANFAFQDAK